MPRKRKTAFGFWEPPNQFVNINSSTIKTFSVRFIIFFLVLFLLRAHQELVIQHYESSVLTDPMPNPKLSFEFLGFSKLLIHNIGPFQQRSYQAMEFHVLAKDQPPQHLICPLREGADLVSLGFDKFSFFNSTFGACAPKIFSPIFCNRRATWLDALSLFFFV